MDWSNRSPPPATTTERIGRAGGLAVAYFVDDFLQWRSGADIDVVAGVVGSPCDLGTVAGAGGLLGPPCIERGFAVHQVGVTDLEGAVLQLWCALPDDQVTRSRQIAGARPRSYRQLLLDLKNSLAAQARDVCEIDQVVDYLSK